MQLTPTLAIYDTMQSLKSPVGTHCVGFAYNLAGFILAAGQKVIFLFFSTGIWVDEDFSSTIHQVDCEVMTAQMWYSLGDLDPIIYEFD